eukprot:1137968-Pelagomonas_calceolata.AAC.2
MKAPKRWRGDNSWEWNASWTALPRGAAAEGRGQSIQAVIEQQRADAERKCSFFMSIKGFCAGCRISGQRVQLDLKGF